MVNFIFCFVMQNIAENNVIIQSLTGNLEDFIYRSTTSQVHLQFVSDFILTRVGFIATYKSYNIGK